MALDYRKFKTPFYEIEIADSKGGRAVKLPHHILRLVEKVEIYEVFANDEVKEFGTLNLVFIEGSREPASPDPALGTRGLYKIPLEGDNVDTDISGSLTNRTGIITDLRFSGSGGITFLTDDEKKKGRVDSTLQKNVIDKNTTREYPREPRAPSFLFQERNQIKVTWGYKEDPLSVRSFIGHIIMVSTDFPEAGHPRTTITCQEPAAFLDQIAATKGITFGKRVTTSKGNSIVTFEDIPTTKVVKDLADKSGMAAIVSKNIPAETVDKHKQKMWIAGESFTQFMNRLAEASNCYWRIIINPKTRKETLIFIKKSDFEARVILPDSNLLTYKAPGSILKNVSIKADFGGIIGTTEKSVDQEGNTVSEQNKDEMVTQFKPSGSTKKEELLDADPTKSNPVPSAKGVVDGVLAGDYTGSTNNNPSESKQDKEDAAKIKAGTQSRLIAIEFTTIGYTKLRPGVVEVKGIGVRYSGKYRLLTVNHMLDNSGYITKCTGVSQSLAAGGVKVQDAPSGQEPEEQVTLKQFERVNSTVDKDVRSQLDKAQGVE